MTPARSGPADPPQPPDSVRVMDTAEQPFLSRAQRRAARSANPDVSLPPIAAVPRILAVIATLLSAALLGVSAFAGRPFLSAALLLGMLVVAWGWPRAAGLPSPMGSSSVLALAGLLLIASVQAAERAPYLRWTAAAVAVSLLAVFLQQLLRRDGRPRLTESVMGTGLGLVVLASATAYLPLVEVTSGPQLIACATAAIAVGSGADLLVRYPAVRPWLLPLSMVLGGFASVSTSLLVGAPDIPPAALVGVSTAALAHALRQVVAPEAGSYSSQGQIATGVASLAIAGPLLWAIHEIAVR